MEVAECMYESLSGNPVVPNDYPSGPTPQGPRSLVMAHGNAGSYFHYGMHYRTVESVYRQDLGVTVQLCVVVQLNPRMPFKSCKKHNLYLGIDWLP